MDEPVVGKRPLIEVAFTWSENEPKDKSFVVSNGGDDEARNVQIQPLMIGKYRFTFDRLPQLLPGHSANRQPQPGDTMGLLFCTIIDAVELAIADRVDELRAASLGASIAEQFARGKAAREEFEDIPVTVKFEDRRGRVTFLEYGLTTYVFAHAQSAELELIHEVQMSGERPKPMPPLRVDAADAHRVIQAKRDEGAHLFDNDERFTSEMQDRFFEWMKSTGGDLVRLYWSEGVSTWFHTGTKWIAGDYRGTIETRDDRLKVLDEILADLQKTVAPAPAVAMHEFEYDVCLSFAGEQRDYVERVYNALKTEGVRAFYDKADKANLWGKDGYEHLNTIYRDRARYCVMFISKEYSEKHWTSHERRSAQARAFRDNREYILPPRFDATEIPGLNETVFYVDLRDHTPEALADLIEQKLNTSAAFERKPSP